MLARRAGELAAPRGGFNALEAMSALAILSVVTSFASSLPRTAFRKERMKSVVREVNALVLSARMEAVKRNRDVVLFVDVANRTLQAWPESSPANLVQDAGEPTVLAYSFPGFVAFRGLSGPVDGPDAVAFDTYRGDPSLKDRIVFRADGSLLPPQAENSRLPGRPRSYSPRVPYPSVACRSSGCRGIFLSDRADDLSGRNLFRISVDDVGHVGKVSIGKWVPTAHGGNPGESDFAPSPWTWSD